MLSWDDYEDTLETAIPAIAAQNAAAQMAAQQTLQAADKPEPQPAAPKQDYKPATNSDAVARAQQAVADLDPAPGLEELAMGAARV
ncbi:MAG TPA: ribonucleotide-diphosphate reductase subunit beta, partial [Marinagarivorans sp.]|nr:ribonucleotide-diphosphate reductase subunit beta [Marinagarivorans sp.]